MIHKTILIRNGHTSHKFHQSQCQCHVQFPDSLVVVLDCWNNHENFCLNLPRRSGVVRKWRSKFGHGVFPQSERRRDSDARRFNSDEGIGRNYGKR